jgi:hypothetical protein
MTPNPGCSPTSHLRTDVCSASGCRASGNGQLYTKGVASCTTIPFYLPRQIPNASGNSWYQIAEIKDFSSTAADWSVAIAGSGVSRLNIGFAKSGTGWVPDLTRIARSQRWSSRFSSSKISSRSRSSIKAPLRFASWHTVFW